MSTPAAALRSHLRQISVLNSCGSVLSWDEQTFLPPGGAQLRSEQLSLLAGLVHERATSPQLQDLISAAAESLDCPTDARDAVLVREAQRNFDKATRLPRRLVEELSRVTTLSQQAWVQARQQSSFSQFEPWLQQIVALKQEQADCLAPPSGVRYDALLDDYEPDASSEQIAAVFTALRPPLVELVSRLTAAPHRPSRELITRHFPAAAQEQFCRLAAERIGFSFEHGRLDVAAHPFCSGVGPGDCRLTTRYDEHYFPMAFFGTLHEAGHGIYEQGLPADDFGTGPGEAVSLGIHESQSRLWENLVGRSRSFWDHFLPTARQMFPAALAQTEVSDFYRAINTVQPSFIRVEADEVTYNLHVMLRFDLERALIAGDLVPADVPGAWNETFVAYFGLTPPDDAQGCLQDVHWSAGLMGYFPTYALGNMYASQLFEAAEAQLGDLHAQFHKGKFEPLKTWLNTQIHQRGKTYPAAQLIEVITGQPLSAEPLLRHLRRKFLPIYNLT